MQKGETQEERLKRIEFAANMLALIEVREHELEPMLQRVNENISQFNELLPQLYAELEQQREAEERGEVYDQKEMDRLTADITTLNLQSPTAFYWMREFYKRKDLPEVVAFMLECFDQAIRYLDGNIQREWNELGKLYSPEEKDVAETLLSVAVKIMVLTNAIEE